MSEVPQSSNSLGRLRSLLSEIPHGLIVVLNKSVSIMFPETTFATQFYSLAKHRQHPPNRFLLRE